MPRRSSNSPPRLSCHELCGIACPRSSAPPAKRQHSLVDNSPFDTNPGSNHATHQTRDDDEGNEEAHRHKRLRTSSPQLHSAFEDHPPRPHTTFEEDSHSPRNETLSSPSHRATPMKEPGAEAEAEASTQEDTQRALLINELTNLVSYHLDPMSISGPAEDDLAKAALNLSSLLKQRFGNSSPIDLGEEDDDSFSSDYDYDYDYNYHPLDMAYFGNFDDTTSNASSPTVDGSTTDPYIYTGALARPGWTESEYSGPETPESGYDEDLEDHFAADRQEQIYRVREIVVIDDSDGEAEMEVENPYQEDLELELATTVQVEQEVIEIPDEDDEQEGDDDSVIFTGENVISYMCYFYDRPVRYSPERYI